jgi:DNA-binding GntR family transcriptional regulator
MTLAKRFCVSQASIRQALIELEYHGLVAKRPQRGTFVVNLSRIELHERIAVRIPLETLAWDLARIKMKRTDFDELDTLVESIARDEFEADYNFHAYVWRCAGNDTLFRTLDQISASMFAFVNLSRNILHNGSARAEAHKRLVEGLKQGSSSVCGDIIRAHIEEAYAHFGRDYLDCRELAEQLGLFQRPVEERMR